MDVIDPNWIIEELHDLFSNPETALNELQYPVAQHIISLRMEHELPWQDSDAGYATLDIVGDFYPTAYVMINLRVIFMQAFAEIVTENHDLPKNYPPEDISEVLNCLHITPDIRRIQIETIKELYPTITGEASPGEKNWFRRFLLPLPGDTICFYIGSFGTVNSLWLVLSDDFLMLIMSDWTD